MSSRQKTSASQQDTRGQRYLRALPFAAIVIYTIVAFNPLALVKLIDPHTSSSHYAHENDTVKIKGDITPVGPLNNWLNTNTVIFAPTLLSWDPVSRLQSRQLSLDLSILYAIFLLEGTRRNNKSTWAAWPNAIAMASQVVTVGVVGPVYCLFHYVLRAPLSNFSPADQRLTDIRYVRTILPTVLLCYFVPFQMMTGMASTPDRQVSWMMVWQFYPLLGAISQLILKTFATGKIVQQVPYRDNTALISITVGFLCTIATLSWWDLIVRTPYSLDDLLNPYSGPYMDLPPVMLAVRKIFQVDHIAPFSALLLWLGLMYSDLYKAGIVRSMGSLAVIYTVGAVAVLGAGPGTAVGLGWWYRERLLTTIDPLDKKVA